MASLVAAPRDFVCLSVFFPEERRFARTPVRAKIRPVAGAVDEQGEREGDADGQVEGTNGQPRNVVLCKVVAQNHTATVEDDEEDVKAPAVRLPKLGAVQTVYAVNVSISETLEKRRA